MSFNESDISLFSVPTTELVEILRMIPMLCSSGNFLLWSKLFKRALDTQETRYWSIIIDGPITCFKDDGFIRPAINFELLETINAYFNQRGFHQSHSNTSGGPNVVEWTKHFEINLTWLGSDSLENAFQDFVRFEVSRLHTATENKCATGDTKMIKNETSPTVYKFHEE
ncbi:unnamed protein product [Penicillium discolor]